MRTPDAVPLTIAVERLGSVAALLLAPPRASACFVFAHGAGAGMEHPFMTALALALARRDLATLRYQFPAMQRGSRRPDPPAVAHATVRAAVAEAARRLPSLPLLAGGKSFGGRMTSQAQAIAPLAGVRGLVFVGFPLHPAGRPAVERAAHLRSVACPMLFLQGTRDDLAEMPLLRSAIEPLGGRATLCVVEGADHAFHLPARCAGRQAVDELADAIVAWLPRLASR